MMDREKNAGLAPPEAAGSLAGFTLLEVIIALSIFVIIALIIASAFVSHYRLYNFSAVQSDLKSQSISILDRISRVANESSAIAASHAFGSLTLTSTSTTIVFQLPAKDASDNIISGVYDYIAFKKSPTSTILYEYIDGGAGSIRKTSGKTLSLFVSNVIFRYNSSVASNSTNAEALLTLVKTLSGAEKTYTNSTTVYLRNKQ